MIGAAGGGMEHLNLQEFEQATPIRPEPGLLAFLICGALSCVAAGALIGVYFGMNQIALF